MRFEDVVLELPDIESVVSGVYCIPATDELVDIANKIRKEYGNDDLVGAIYDNDVWYGYYLFFNIEDKTISLRFECNHGVNDDFVFYDIETSKDEKEMLMWKLIEQLLNNLE